MVVPSAALAPSHSIALSLLPEEQPMVDITDVEVLHDQVVRLRFSDGSERVVDLAPFLWGQVFEDIAGDDKVFAQVRVDSRTGTIFWPNGADLDPDVLHGDHQPANPAGSAFRTGPDDTPG